MACLLTLLCLLLATLVLCEDFVLRDHFTNGTLAAAPKLFDMLETYISQHSSKVVLAEKSICNRSFAVATYACPQAIGNHMHEFINNFAGAFVTNRTLVWRFCTRKPCLLDNEGDCNEFTQRFPWILSMWDMEKKWEEDKCEWRQAHHVVHQLIPQKFRFQTEQILICCGLDTDIFPVARLDYGTLELHEMFALSLPVARLRPDSKERAKELFRNGEDFAYGVLFRSTFLIKDNVKGPNNLMVRLHEEHLTQLYNSDPHTRQVTWGSSPPTGPVEVRPFYIGLHIRHSNNDQEEGMDAYGFNCVQTTLKYLQEVQAELNQEAAKKGVTPIVRPCVILLASDRKHEIDKWTNATNVAPLNCTVLVSNHSHAHTAWNEHGPFSGEIAMQDLDLLSRSDAFIGSSYAIPNMMNIVSTFSMLMGELRATNGREHSLRIKSKYLPVCGNAVGAKHNPHEVYNGQDYKCGDSKQIMLPIECPYWNKTSLN